MDINGGSTTGSGGNDDPSVVPIEIRTSDITTAAAPATAIPRRERDPFRRSPLMPSRRVAVYGVLALALLALGGYTASIYLEDRAERKEEQEIAAYAAANDAVAPIVQDYVLPASVHAYATCGFSFRCGTSDAEPRAAAQALAQSFVPLGLEVRDVECGPYPKPTNAECWAELRYDGVTVGTARATREEIPHRIFGAPTTVSVSINRNVEDSSLTMLTEFVDVPLEETDTVFAKLDADGVDAFHCTEKTKDGCRTYSTSTSADDSRQAAWTRAGRSLVTDGWRGVRGRCDPASPKSPCDVHAVWYLPSGAEVHLSKRVTTDGDGAKVRTDVRVASKVLTSANGVPVSPTPTS